MTQIHNKETFNILKIHNILTPHLEPWFKFYSNIY